MIGRALVKQRDRPPVVSPRIACPLFHHEALPLTSTSNQTTADRLQTADNTRTELSRGYMLRLANLHIHSSISSSTSLQSAQSTMKSEDSYMQWNRVPA